MVIQSRRSSRRELVRDQVCKVQRTIPEKRFQDIILKPGYSLKLLSWGSRLWCRTGVVAEECLMAIIMIFSGRASGGSTVSFKRTGKWLRRGVCRTKRKVCQLCGLWWLDTLFVKSWMGYCSLVKGTLWFVMWYDSKVQLSEFCLEGRIKWPILSYVVESTVGSVW